MSSGGVGPGLPATGWDWNPDVLGLGVRLGCGGGVVIRGQGWGRKDPARTGAAGEADAGTLSVIQLVRFQPPEPKARTQGHSTNAHSAWVGLVVIGLDGDPGGTGIKL